MTVDTYTKLQELGDRLSRLRVDRGDIAILSFMILLSPDRNNFDAISKRDRLQLERAQLIYAAILRIKIQLENRPKSVVWKLLSLMTELRTVDHQIKVHQVI